jgi:hypothetical protein
LEQIAPKPDLLELRRQGEFQVETPQGLWAAAIGFRRLVMAATCFSIAAVLFAVDLGHSVPENSAPACNSSASGLPRQPPPLGSGVVVRFLSAQEAANLLRITEARLGITIDPDYRLNKRAVVRRGVGPVGPTITALVPLGMDVQVGDQVDMQGFQIDPSSPCHYIPNLVARKQ